METKDDTIPVEITLTKIKKNKQKNLHKKKLDQFYLWDTQSTLKNFTGLTEADPEKYNDLNDTIDLSNLEISNTKSCSACNVSFTEVRFMKSHYKLDWHRYNLKLKSASLPGVTETQFDSLISNSFTGEDIPSISGSDDSDYDDEEELKKVSSPLAVFNHPMNKKVYSFYKCVLPICPEKFISSFQSDNPINIDPKCAVILFGGGHFAAAIFDGDTPTHHKTFHAYTVRKGQGGSQSMADNKAGSRYKSAGSSLRRYNESSLESHVLDILQSWSSILSEVSRVYYRASTCSLRILFSKNSPLNKSKSKTIPFATKRATYNEVKRVHQVLNSVKISEPQTEASIQSLKSKKNKKINRSKSREIPSRSFPDVVQEILDDISDPEIDLQEEVVAQKVSLAEFEIKINENEHENQLITACMVGDLGSLKNVISSNEGLVNLKIGENLQTPLILATKRSHKSLISFLLSNGADPTIKDKHKKLPYFYASSKEVRNVFRNFSKENPSKYNYKAAQIPPAPTEAEIESRIRQEKIRKEAKKIKKQNSKLKVKEVIEEQKERDRFLGLSDREKRALAAERRAISSGSAVVVVRCFQCGCDITGKIPFQYLDFSFCTVSCLQKHKKVVIR